MVFTGGIFIATWVQVVIYYRQAGIMQETLKQNERSITLGRGQLAVAGRNAAIAEAARRDASDSFAKTLEQMEAQTTTQQTAADASKLAAETARRQLDLTINQATARLQLENIKLPKFAPVVSFDLANEGNSEAIRFAMRIGSAWHYPTADDFRSIVDTPLQPDPGGLTILKGGKIPYELGVDAPGPRQAYWYMWQKFAYVDIFGIKREICEVEYREQGMSGETRHVPCDSTVPEKEKQHPKHKEQGPK